MKKMIMAAWILMATGITMAATIDVLFVYDKSAQDWLSDAGVSPSELTASSVEKLNRVMANSGISSAGDFRSVGELLVPSSGTGDVVSMLTDVVCDNTGKGHVRDGYDWDKVHQYREKVGADVVCVLTRIAAGAAGIGWEFDAGWPSPSLYSTYAYCIASVEAAAHEDGYVVPHEIGHLLGAGHADVSTYGDGDGTDGPCHDAYSSAFYLSTSSGNYATLLAYTPKPGSSEIWQTIPYFSNPDIDFEGVPMGDANHNNAKTVKDNFAIVAAFRKSVKPKDPVVDPKDPQDPKDDPTPAPIPDVTTAYTKAVTVSGALIDAGDEVAGIVQLKLGKYNQKKNEVKVSGSIILPNGKKVAAKAKSFTPKGNRISGLLSFKAPVNDVAIVVDYDPAQGYVLESDGLHTEGYSVKKAIVGGLENGTAILSVDASSSEGFDWLSSLTPDGTAFDVAGAKWTFPKAGKVKYAKNRETQEMELQYDPEAENNAGVKLSFAAKTGIFKGTFTIYALETNNGRTKLAKYKFTVNGLVVDGVGRGVAVCKKPAMSWPVVVK
ncbi:MAG: zinc-dependent metalloprotease [Kiritimatiellae bacterium]|nr:zinc-dependent metalloprotease [Kiritimatiellia bacterium]